MSPATWNSTPPSLLCSRGRKPFPYVHPAQHAKGHPAVTPPPPPRFAQFTSYRTVQNDSSTSGYVLLGHQVGTNAGEVQCFPTPIGGTPGRDVFTKADHFLGNVTDPASPGVTYSLYYAPGWTSAVESAILAVNWAAPAPGTDNANGPQRLASVTVNFGPGAFSRDIKVGTLTFVPTILLAFEDDGIVPKSTFETPSICNQ